DREGEDAGEEDEDEGREDGVDDHLFAHREGDVDRFLHHQAPAALLDRADLVQHLLAPSADDRGVLAGHGEGTAHEGPHYIGLLEGALAAGGAGVGPQQLAATVDEEDAEALPGLAPEGLLN